MAADEVLLQNARPGLALLRFYGWSTPTLSLGYFQPSAARAPWANLPFVRRATGGGTLLHHHELTYALAITIRERPAVWLRRAHGVIARALGRCSIRTEFVEADVRKSADPLCFRQFAFGDVVCRGVKVVGSAQRKRGQRLLQHGAVLLAKSEHAPELSGILERTGLSLAPALLQTAIENAFVKVHSWRIERRPWTVAEQDLIRRLSAEKYSQVWWNERR